MSLSWPLALVLLAWLGTNVYATFAILRAPDLSSLQRSGQYVFIWLVPIVGAVVCLAMASTNARTGHVIEPPSGGFGESSIGSTSDMPADSAECGVGATSCGDGGSD